MNKTRYIDERNIILILTVFRLIFRRRIFGAETNRNTFVLRRGAYGGEVVA